MWATEGAAIVAVMHAVAPPRRRRRGGARRVGRRRFAAALRSPDRSATALSLFRGLLGKNVSVRELAPRAVGDGSPLEDVFRDHVADGAAVADGLALLCARRRGRSTASLTTRAAARRRRDAGAARDVFEADPAFAAWATAAAGAARVVVGGLLGGGGAARPATAPAVSSAILAERDAEIAALKATVAAGADAAAERDGELERSKADRETEARRVASEAESVERDQGEQVAELEELRTSRRRLTRRTSEFSQTMKTLFAISDHIHDELKLAAAEAARDAAQKEADGAVDDLADLEDRLFAAEAKLKKPPGDSDDDVAPAPRPRT
ncbi:hypothetical protein JL720_9134 [Aureococcus anophagefferens]|nr:hypothetical protein JL720_9134 [Aureococcus anophagefferens]